MTKLRIAGAQMPVTTNLHTNVESIKNMIDRAAALNAHYLVTPEGAVTGYVSDWETRDGRTYLQVLESIGDIIDYAAEKNIGMFLGTLCRDADAAARNSVIITDRKGNTLERVDKTLIIKGEPVKPQEHPKHVFLPELGNVPISVMICNDLWGSTIYRQPALPWWALDTGVRLVIHSTNGPRNRPDELDSVYSDWHNAWLQMMSLYMQAPILSVDNCIGMEGEDYEGDTASPSGVVENGKWLVQSPRQGEHIFVHEFDIEKLISNNG